MNELEKLLQDIKCEVIKANNRVIELEKELANAKKPIMTAEQSDKVYEVLCEGFEQLADNIFDSGDVDYEFEIDYDNRIAVSHATFNGDASRDLDEVHDEIISMFNVQPPVAEDSKE